MTTTTIRAVAFDQITRTVCHRLGVDPSELAGRNRGSVADARALVAYYARRMTEMSYPEIAMRIGKTGHSSIMGAERRVIAAINHPHISTLAKGLADLFGRPFASVLESIESEILTAARRLLSLPQLPH